VDPQQSRWRPTRRQVLWASGILIFVICSYVFGWKWTGLPKRTLWDWLELLIVPGALAFGVYWLNQRQAARAEAEAAARRRREAQDEALQEYLEKVSQRMPDLRSSGEDSEVRTWARSFTMAVLPRLDGERKGSAVQFLYEAGLITKDHVVVDLMGANLAKANLTDADLKGASLRGAYLARAKLDNAKLSKADLRDTKLFGAILFLAKLDGANLSWAVLIGDGRSPPLPRVSKTISPPELHGPGPQNADLKYADLRGADLTDAFVSEEQLSSVDFLNLQGATLPDGQKYEDWRKDR
jgi:uncharacterized protein YjbI with pentapeptide repeats